MVSALWTSEFGRIPVEANSSTSHRSAITLALSPQSNPSKILSSSKPPDPAPIKEIRVPNNSAQSAKLVIDR